MMINHERIEHDRKAQLDRLHIALHSRVWTDNMIIESPFPVSMRLSSSRVAFSCSHLPRTMIVFDQSALFSTGFFSRAAR